MSENRHGITRREAVRRVGFMLGGVALVGGSGLLTACGRDTAERREQAQRAGVGTFTADDVAFLDEVADTILPDTKTPGAKAAKTGAFMALMVTDTYDPREQQRFRDGMRALDAASVKANGSSFVKATPPQRLALLESLDREQKRYMDAREAARTAKATTAAASAKADAHLPDQRQENAPSAADANPAPAVTGAAADSTAGADSPPHYFRMMKELALLGYFTSEIGCTQAMHYEESPGRFDPCVPYKPGDKAWAPHA